MESASGFMFCSFDALFNNVKAPVAKPSQSQGSGQIDYFLKGEGDAYVLVTDGSGNTATAFCLLPQTPSCSLHSN